MSQFLGVHKMKTIGVGSDQKSVSAFRKYQKEARKIGLNATHVHYSLEKGFAYCITEAQNAEQVRKAHANANIPLDDVIEVKTVS